MSPASSHATQRARWLRPRMSTYWWLESWAYLTFILRELSSVFVAWFVVYLLFLVRAVNDGESAYRAFLLWSGHPAVLFLNIVTLLFILFHAITWFNLAPQAMVVKMRNTPVPGFVIAASNYAAWGVVSVLLAWLLLSGG